MGETEPAFTDWDGEQKYSWVKAPRFKGDPMQVGPLAPVLIGYAQGHPLTRKYTDLAIGKVQAIGWIHATPEMLHSTLGRHAARAIRAAMLAELAQKHWQLLVDNIAKGDFTTMVDTLLSAEFFGIAPADVLLVGIQAGSYETGCRLSQPVQASVDQAIAEVLGELDRLGVEYLRRELPTELGAWWTDDEQIESPLTT